LQLNLRRFSVLRFQEEECRVEYIKKCELIKTVVAENVTLTVCRKPLVKDCDTWSGDQTCATQYEAECVTKHHKQLIEEDIPECVTVDERKCKEVANGYTTEEECTTLPRHVCSVKKVTRTKQTPETACHKVPTVLCGPKGCGFKEGADECREELKTVIFDKPEEICNLSPTKSCKIVKKLVPKLKEVEKCSDIPKEVCARVKKNPHKIKYPVIKKWCYKYKDTRIGCSEYCRGSSKWGECPVECKEWEGCPDCCAPQNCPAACTNKRRDECSALGVVECGGIPGCCPEKFDSVIQF